MIVIVLLGRQATQHRHAGAHHIHRVRRGRQLFECGFQRRRQAAQGFQLALVGRQLGDVRQFAVDQQVRDFLELTGTGHVQNVVATVVQIIATATDGTQGGVACSGARQGNGLLGLETGSGGGGFGHVDLQRERGFDEQRGSVGAQRALAWANSASSFCS